MTLITLSLRNMYKELMDDISGFTLPAHGYLAGWAQQGLSLSHTHTHTHTYTVYTFMHPTTGVLLLNACLTVKERQPNSHAGRVTAKIKDWEVFDTILQYAMQGWERLTDAVIHWINDHMTRVVFLLWGSYAQKKGAFINQVREKGSQTVLDSLMCFLHHY